MKSFDRSATVSVGHTTWWPKLGLQSWYLTVWVISLAPAKYKMHLRWLTFKLFFVMMAELYLVKFPPDECHWMTSHSFGCPHGTSHFLNQCWSRSMSPHGATRPRWVESLLQFSFQYHVPAGETQWELFFNEFGPGLLSGMMLESMLVNKDFLTWFLIGWWLCCQTMKCQV